MQKIRYLSALLIFCMPLLASAFSPLANLKVESTWGNADPRDVKAVLDSANSIISAYAGNRTLGNIIIRNDTKGPISLYDRGDNGEYIVLLDIKGRYWAQLAYQFSHEVCHLLTNYDLAPNNITRQQWFEESLCEAFSLFILERMSEQWTETPPYPNWKSYSVELLNYSNNMQQQEHRKYAIDLRDWYREHQQTLEKDPYAQNRRLNEKIATHLLTLFEREPESWGAINYLNLGDNTNDRSFTKYLNDWYQNAPAPYKDTVAKIQQLIK